MPLNPDALLALIDATNGYAKALTEAHAEITATPKETTYTRGQRVRVLGVSRYGAHNEGEIGVVGDPNHFGGTVEVFVDGTQFVYAPRDIEPADAPARPPPTVTVKVGDTVRITEGYVGGLTSAVIGRVGEVTNIGEPDYTGRRCIMVDGCTAAAVELVAPAVSPRLNIASKNDDRRIEILPSPYVCGPGGVEMILTEPGTGKKVFAYMKPEQMRQIIATLEANLA